MATEFARAVRRFRERLTPAEAGLIAGGRRRSPGLRREELGRLAGISVDYVNRIEQGRATAPSPQVVEALCRALRLDAAEREQLFGLAGLRAPGRGTVPGHLTPGVQRLLDRLSGTPVAVFDAAWNLLLANDLWLALAGGPPDRNVARMHFLGDPPQVHQTAEDNAAFEAAIVGDLRAARARYPADAGLRALTDELLAGSETFATLWERGDSGTHTASRKTVNHPVVGPMELDCDVLTAPGSDVRIVAYTAAPYSEAESRLALLDVIGREQLARRMVLPGPMHG
ncbi:helix-turn-helix transcriptional regulator [Paractinoplanes lichenicola]|uniref:Helix-turn-helix domain-containing protein n=1 Tax=Paractinoplanes lichenicola TaxID=2802976 RepID=A0ABS1W3L7_9ACTN|nr:helix-turn-helix transcriptional regulator [Actinoplanes lichenicola]MBL7261335.1 helix-turn-helix domain-containing protein [Actinoplanes lichenicola]